MPYFQLSKSALILLVVLQLSACQSFQFVDSPIPVTADFSQTIASPLPAK
ncbi:hypothetical protein [Psychrobacter ciconiae]|nr:hypothetical protein [Psychrobacter ciconiae]